MVLKSLRFCSEGEVDAYNFPQEEKSKFITWGFSEESEEYDEEGSSTISQESTLLPAISTSEFESDDDIHTTLPQNDDSESDDESVHRHKPEQWIDYSKPEDVEVCTGREKSVSDVDDEESASDVVDEASSPEPQELSTIYECDQEFEDGQQDDEPREADSDKPQQLSPLHESHTEFDDQQDDVPLEADSPEPQRLSIPHPSHPAEFEDEQQDDEPREADSAKPQQLSHLHESHTGFGDKQDDDPLEADSPEPQRPSTFHQSHPAEFNDEQLDDEPHKAESPEPQRLSTLRQFHPAEFDDEQQDDDKSIESNSPEPRRLFPFDLPEFEPYQPSASEIEGFCPGPLRRFLSPDSILKLDAFEEWFVQMSEWISFRDAAAAFSPDQAILSETASSSSPEPRRLFPVHQFHPTLYDPQPPSTPAPQRDTEIICPKPVRQYPTHKVILQPELFEDWFVDMSEPVFIDEAINISPDQPQSIARPSRPAEAQKLFPVVDKYNYPEFDMKGDESLEADDSPVEPGRILSGRHIDSSLYHGPHHQAVSPQLDDDEALESFEYITLESLNL